jgi:hypothetical protein
MLVLAVSENVLLQALPALLPHLALDCLLVETLSIKNAFATLVRDVSLPQTVVGLNPMFSGDLAPEGRPVVVVPYQAGAAIDDLRERLTSRGMRLYTLTAQQHDQTMALLQTVGHSMVLAFGHTSCSQRRALGAIDRAGATAIQGHACPAGPHDDQPPGRVLGKSRPATRPPEPPASRPLATCNTWMDTPATTPMSNSWLPWPACAITCRRPSLNWRPAADSCSRWCRRTRPTPWQKARCWALTVNASTASTISSST